MLLERGGSPINYAVIDPLAIQLIQGEGLNLINFAVNSCFKGAEKAFAFVYSHTVYTECTVGHFSYVTSGSGQNKFEISPPTM